MTHPIQGTVNRWIADSSRGSFSFIVADDGQQVFLHQKECERCGVRTPREGDRLEFSTQQGSRGLRAVGVRYVR